MLATTVVAASLLLLLLLLLRESYHRRALREEREARWHTTYCLRFFMGWVAIELAARTDGRQLLSEPRQFCHDDETMAVVADAPGGSYVCHVTPATLEPSTRWVPDTEDPDHDPHP